MGKIVKRNQREAVDDVSADIGPGINEDILGPNSEPDEEQTQTCLDGRFTSERAKALSRRQRLAMSDLPQYLEKVTGRGLRVIDNILKLRLDEHNGPLIRAQVTAALGVVSSQLRADEARLKRKVTGDALQRLFKIVEEQRKLLGKSVPVSAKDTDSADLVEETPVGAVDGVKVSGDGE